MKKWDILRKNKTGDLIAILLENRGLQKKKDIDTFLHPPNPYDLTADDVGIDKKQLSTAVKRIKKAIDNKESIVVYADYDADGITAGAVMWETLYKLGARVMPYIPSRSEEGYGLSIKGIDAVKEKHNPTLIITVDHGITAHEKVEYAKSIGIEVLVTDHHVPPKKVPDAIIVHTTTLSGAGVSWFLSKEVSGSRDDELVALAAIGTIADMMSLIGPNRSIAKYGLAAINATTRVGLEALIADASLAKGAIATFEVSHMLAPRLNAMGRLEHALDALRLVCTKNVERAQILATQIGLTNKERQQLTLDTTTHAISIVASEKRHEVKKLLFVVHETYNQGVIGLVAGKLVEEYYLPSIVIAKGDPYSKASARSISGFNIVEAIRTCVDILVDVGGHPMAAGFTVETKNLGVLQDRLEQLAAKELTAEKLERVLKIDTEIPLDQVTEELWQSLRDFEPFGFGNPEPVFATRSAQVIDARFVGATGKHLKLRVTNDALRTPIEAIAFNMGNLYGQLQEQKEIDIAYTVALDTWNGNRRLQLKIKDVHLG